MIEISSNTTEMTTVPQTEAVTELSSVGVSKTTTADSMTVPYDGDFAETNIESAITTTVPTFYYKGVDENEQTGVSEYTSRETAYSGHTQAAPAESCYSSEEEKSGAVSQAAGIDEDSSPTETVTESIAVHDSTSEAIIASEPVITLNMQQAQAFTLLAGAFGVFIAALVITGKIRRRSKAKKELSPLTAKERDEIRLREENGKKFKPKKPKTKRKPPRTVQESLPYRRVCDEYIFMVDDGKYSKTYQFEDINYQIAKQDEQESIFLGYCSVLNSFDTNAEV